MQPSSEIIRLAPAIRSEIQKAGSILLHCHPSPDPDSVGSALAMKFVLEQMGKKATVIRGDSETPRAFMHFPGAAEIVQKNFFDVDLSAYDLFIIMDSGSKEMISRYKPIALPLPLRTVIIDHHASNKGYADVNLVETSYPAVCQILFDLFTLWQVRITPEIAGNLFMGIYTDTGGFKYDSTTPHTFSIACELAKIIPQFPKIIADMENSNELEDIAFQALALNSIQTFLGGRFGLSVIPLNILAEKGIPLKNVHGDMISPILRTVAAWQMSGIMIEIAPQTVKISFRSKDGSVVDVSKLAVALGGGGHKAAAGATLMMPLADAVSLVVAKAKELYNL